MPVCGSMMLGDNSPPSCLKNRNKDLASQALASCLLLNASATKAYDNLGRSSECDSSECDAPDSSDPPCCWETLRRTTGALTPLLFCCETFQRAKGALTTLPLPFCSFFATSAFSASLASKLSSSLTVLGSVLFRANEVTCLPFTWRDMKHFRGTFGAAWFV